MRQLIARIHQALLAVTQWRRVGASLLEALQLARRGATPIAGGSGLFIDLLNLWVRGQTVVPQVATSTVTGNGVDLDFTQVVFAELQVGAVSGTTPTLDVKLQESDTSGGTYTDIPGATIAQVTASTKIDGINAKRSKRWVRAVATIAGTTPSFALAVSLWGYKREV